MVLIVLTLSTNDFKTEFIFRSYRFRFSKKSRISKFNKKVYFLIHLLKYYDCAPKCLKEDLDV